MWWREILSGLQYTGVLFYSTTIKKSLLLLFFDLGYFDRLTKENYEETFAITLQYKHCSV